MRSVTPQPEKTLVFIAIMVFALAFASLARGVDWEAIQQYNMPAQPMNAQQMQGRIPYLPAEVDVLVQDASDPTTKTLKRKKYSAPSSRDGKHYRMTP